MVAITTNGGSSIGYVATTADDTYDTAEWAIAQPGLGERYWVESQSAGEVVRVPSLARTVSIGKGRIGAFGVVDTLVGDTQAAQLLVAFPNPSSGSVHHLVTCRRRWETTNASSIETVTGTSSPTVPARPYTNPGNTRDDQPLALYRVAKDDPVPYLVADLRVVGNKGRYEATSKLVLDIPGYVDHPGYVVRIAGTDYLRTAAGAWEEIASPIEQVASFGNSVTPNWTGGSTLNQSYMFRRGRERKMYLEQRRVAGGPITPTASGSIPNETTFTLAEGDKPLTPVVCQGLYLADNGADYGCTVVVNPSGAVVLCAFGGSATMAGALAGSWSFRFSAEWFTA